MERYLGRHGKEVRRYIEKVPHVPTLTPMIADRAQVRVGGGQVSTTRPINDDLDMMEKDEISFCEVSCGVPPNNFYLIMNCKSIKEIWDVLKNLYERTK